MIYTISGAVIGIVGTATIMGFRRNRHSDLTSGLLLYGGLLMGAAVGFGYGLDRALHGDHIYQRLIEYAVRIR
jgi:hypothetical protein